MSSAFLLSLLFSEKGHLGVKKVCKVLANSELTDDWRPSCSLIYHSCYCCLCCCYKTFLMLMHSCWCWHPWCGFHVVGSNPWWAFHVFAGILGFTSIPAFAGIFSIDGAPSFPFLLCLRWLVMSNLCSFLDLFRSGKAKYDSIKKFVIEPNIFALFFNKIWNKCGTYQNVLVSFRS